MDVIWENGPLAARDVYYLLVQKNSNKQWAYKTVKTFLARLVKKNAISYTRVGNSYLYETFISREESARIEVNRLTQTVCGVEKSELVLLLLQELGCSESMCKRIMSIVPSSKRKHFCKPPVKRA